MEFNKAKEFLKNKYLVAGFKLIDEHSNEVFLEHQDQKILITEEDINEYAESAQFRSSLENLPVECSICSFNYREQLLISLDYRPIQLILRERILVFGDSNENELYVEVGPATMQFINYFRFKENYFQAHMNRFRFKYKRYKEDLNKIDIREFLYSPPTIRVYNINKNSIELALKKSSEIIESCLFELSYLKNISVRLAEEWPYKRSHQLNKSFEFHKMVVGYNLPLPKARFNSDFLKFYQLGQSSNIPILEFLAYYLVLEYFFIEVSDEHLYEKLSNRLKDPFFKISPTNLDKLIIDVQDHKRITDEKEMLKMVINKFVDKAQLIEFIQAYEDFLNEKRYTKQRTLFGEDIQIQLKEGHVIGNIAKTIKIVRNALVHSSDIYDRNIRHVPFSESTEIIKGEIPLVKFLAERVIIASASTIE